MMRGRWGFGGWGLKSLRKVLFSGFKGVSLERTSWGELESDSAAVAGMDSVGVGVGETVGKGVKREYCCRDCS
ncbi:hypothetical protein FF1_027615 [Malus domestica]